MDLSTHPTDTDPTARDQRARSLRRSARRAAARGGVAALSEREILGLLGGSRVDAPTLERLAAVELSDLARRDPERLRTEAGLPRGAALRLAAAFELGRRVERTARRPRQPLRAPARVHEVMVAELRGLERETFHVLLLDGRHRLRRIVRVSEGTLTSSLVHPREFFAPAVREAAAAVIAVHNHPSGDPEPSAEDLAITRRLAEAGNLLGIPLLDHVVVADEGWTSLRERMRFL